MFHTFGTPDFHVYLVRELRGMTGWAVSNLEERIKALGVKSQVYFAFFSDWGLLKNRVGRHSVRGVLWGPLRPCFQANHGSRTQTKPRFSTHSILTTDDTLSVEGPLRPRFQASRGPRSPVSLLALHFEQGALAPPGFDYFSTIFRSRSRSQTSPCH